MVHGTVSLNGRITGVCVMQLTELAADYQDEHTTSTQTAEMLEAETTERIRLDKEVKELQVGGFGAAV